MHLLLISTSGKPYIIKKSDIRRVEISTTLKHKEKQCMVYFTGTKNTPISMPMNVAEFYTKHMTK